MLKLYEGIEMDDRTMLHAAICELRGDWKWQKDTEPKIRYVHGQWSCLSRSSTDKEWCNIQNYYHYRCRHVCHQCYAGQADYLIPVSKLRHLPRHTPQTFVDEVCKAGPKCG